MGFFDRFRRRRAADPAARRDQVLGGLLGVHAGDSLGATLEFAPWSRIRQEYPDGHREIVGGGAFGWAPGDATDDTDLTVAVLGAYTDTHGYTPHGAATRMAAWYQRGPRDVGGATSRGLSRFIASGDPARAGAGQGSAGNGSLMRCIPTGLIRGDDAARHRESAEISAVTHDDHACVGSCVAYNHMVHRLLEGDTPQQAVAAARALTDETLGPAAADVRAALDAGETLDLAALAADGGNPYGGSGYVLHSLALAVAAVEDPRSFEDVIADVAYLGGDTDTNAAIAGGLVGVRDGASAIPDRWVDKLQYRDLMVAAADRIADGDLADQGTVPGSQALADAAAQAPRKSWRAAHMRTLRDGRRVPVRAARLR